MSQISFSALRTLSIAADVLIAWACVGVMLRRVGRPGARGVGLAPLTRSAAATVLLIALKLWFLHRRGVAAFGLVHFIYLDLTVLLPLTGLAVLLVSGLRSRTQSCWKLTRLARLALASSLVMIPVGVYASWIEPFRLRVESASLAISSRREGRAPVRVAVLSDLQTNRVTDYERAAVARLMAQEPDIIVMPGDVFQGTREEFDATRYDLRDLLSQLSAPGGVYLVLGDTDGAGGHLEEILGSSQVQILRNEVARVRVRDRTVSVGGVTLQAAAKEARELVAGLEQAPGNDDLRILVAHRPDVMFELAPGSRIDLVVAGHTHGGQVVLPIYGPPLTLTQVPRDVAAGGLHRVGGNAIYVSRGVGCERGQAPRIRFLCPPEISLIELAERTTR
jgi:predicted MPP superfamily phosphohydrolase